MGGIGKTQVALHYVYHFQKAYSHILWVTADSPASLVTECVKLARDLELPEKDEEDPSRGIGSFPLKISSEGSFSAVSPHIEQQSLLRLPMLLSASTAPLRYYWRIQKVGKYDSKTGYFPLPMGNICHLSCLKKMEHPYDNRIRQQLLALLAHTGADEGVLSPDAPLPDD